jgi:hypothetical protein
MAEAEADRGMDDIYVYKGGGNNITPTFGLTEKRDLPGVGKSDGKEITLKTITNKNLYPANFLLIEAPEVPDGTHVKIADLIRTGINTLKWFQFDYVFVTKGWLEGKNGIPAGSVPSNSKTSVGNNWKWVHLGRFDQFGFKSGMYSEELGYRFVFYSHPANPYFTIRLWAQHLQHFTEADMAPITNAFLMGFLDKAYDISKGYWVYDYDGIMADMARIPTNASAISIERKGVINISGHSPIQIDDWWKNNTQVKADLANRKTFMSTYTMDAEGTLPRARGDAADRAAMGLSPLREGEIVGRKEADKRKREDDEYRMALEEVIEGGREMSESEFKTGVDAWLKKLKRDGEEQLGKLAELRNNTKSGEERGNYQKQIEDLVRKIGEAEKMVLDFYKGNSKTGLSGIKSLRGGATPATLKARAEKSLKDLDTKIKEIKKYQLREIIMTKVADDREIIIEGDIVNKAMVEDDNIDFERFKQGSTYEELLSALQAQLMSLDIDESKKRPIDNLIRRYKFSKNETDLKVAWWAMKSAHEGEIIGGNAGEMKDYITSQISDLLDIVHSNKLLNQVAYNPAIKAYETKKKEAYGKMRLKELESTTHLLKSKGRINMHVFDRFPKLNAEGLKHFATKTIKDIVTDAKVPNWWETNRQYIRRNKDNEQMFGHAGDFAYALWDKKTIQENSMWMDRAKIIDKFTLKVSAPSQVKVQFKIYIWKKKRLDPRLGKPLYDGREK